MTQTPKNGVAIEAASRVTRLLRPVFMQSDSHAQTAGISLASSQRQPSLTPIGQSSMTHLPSPPITMPAPKQHEPPFKEKWHNVLQRRLGFFFLKPIEWVVEHTSLVGRGNFLDTAKFPWIGSLEANWLTIREEMDRVLERREDVLKIQELSSTEEFLAWDNKWRTFVFDMFGHKSAANSRFCPRTTKLVEAVPGMTAAFFSIVDPGKHIPAHRGIYKGVLRYHLGLRIPRPVESSRFRVGSDTVHWEEGKSLIFDDSMFHEVWADGHEPKVILIIDVLRPCRFPGNLLNKVVVWLIHHSIPMRKVARNMARSDVVFHGKAAAAYTPHRSPDPGVIVS